MVNSGSNSARHADRDNRVIQFVVEYRAVPHAVLDREFFGGRSCGNAVARLSRKEPDQKSPALLLPHRNALPGGLSYVQPSAAACRRFGASVKRSAPFGAAALSLNLGIAYFCAFGAHPRRRLSRKEIEPFLGERAPRDNVPHILTSAEERGRLQILRVYQAGAEVPTSIKHLIRIVDEIQRTPQISSMAATREYGIALLATTSADLKSLCEAVVEERLDREIEILADLGPTAETLQAVLKSRG